MRPPTCAVRAVTRLIDRYAHEPEGISYWKREALAFSSGLLGWPGPLVPVHHYGVEEVSKGQPRIWLEARGRRRPACLKDD
jgi:hypothetical protein